LVFCSQKKSASSLPEVTLQTYEPIQIFKTEDYFVENPSKST
jgi:hypothetical protein